MGEAVTKLQAKLALGELSADEREVVALSAGDENLVELAKGKGKLDWSEKSNWVEDNGGLPEGIESMAVHMMEESGLSREHAIAAAVQRAKVLAAKGQARWVKNVAAWEALKAKAAAKRAKKG